MRSHSMLHSQGSQERGWVALPSPHSVWRMNELKNHQSRAGVPQQHPAGAARPRRPPDWRASRSKGQGPRHLQRGISAAGSAHPGLGLFSLLNSNGISNWCLLVETKLKGFSVTVCLCRLEAVGGKSGGKGHFVQARSGLRL